MKEEDRLLQSGELFLTDKVLFIEVIGGGKALHFGGVPPMKLSECLRRYYLRVIVPISLLVALHQGLIGFKHRFDELLHKKFLYYSLTDPIT